MIEVGVVRERATVLGTFWTFCAVVVRVEAAGAITGVEASCPEQIRDKDNSAISAAMILRF
jgi:hypothetical protein